MTKELFEKVITEVAPFTRIVTLHLMGEPLAHPELKTFLDLCMNQKLQVYFVTNGVLLKDPELLLHPALRQVSFSLHSYYDNFPDKDPSLYLNRIFDFTQLAFEKRPNLFINYRLWNLNSIKGNHKHNEIIYQSIERRFGITIPRDWNFEKDKSLKLLNYLALHYETEFIWPSLELPVRGTQGTCHGLKNHFGILADATVVPCCLDKEGKIPLGNIALTPLKEILKSPRSQAMIRGFQRHHLIEDLCQRCPYIERFET